MSVFLGLLAAVVALYLIVYYNVVKGSRCKSTAVLTGKTAIVTGSANTGIGKSTALELARRGARVIVACRNKQRAEAAIYDIRRESGNNQVVYMQLDLASLKSVRSFAETFLRQEPRLDLLINNAGVIGPGRTEDGFGMAFGVNHLGHFLLTYLLLERLKQTGGARVITVSARLYRLGSVDFSTLAAHKDLVTGQSTVDNIRAYSNSKLCNVLFTRELANRLEGTGVTCYSLHPGASVLSSLSCVDRAVADRVVLFLPPTGVIHTNICRNMSLWLRLAVAPIVWLFFLDVDAGAQTTLHCALQEGIEPLSGRYFSDCAVCELNAKARDDAVAKKLWEVSERLCGLS
ncbi:dehydrogenase/reductase SDR family member 13-like [Arapaima gigas]